MLDKHDHGNVTRDKHKVELLKDLGDCVGLEQLNYRLWETGISITKF